MGNRGKNYFEQLATNRIKFDGKYKNIIVFGEKNELWKNWFDANKPFSWIYKNNQKFIQILVKLTKFWLL